MTSTRTQIIALSRALVDAGLVVAAGGNIAARADDGSIWVTPSGWSLAEVAEGDLVRVDEKGGRIEGARVPSSELPLHLAAFRARPDVTWSVHLHPPMATLLHAVGIPIRCITTDHAFYLRDVATVEYLHPGTHQLADAAADAIAAGADVVLLRHHGCVVVADGPDLAESRAVNVEAAAVATFRARLLGIDDLSCPPEFLDHVRVEEAKGHRYGRRRDEDITDV